MTIANRFDAWVERGPFTPTDLGRFRVMFAILALLTMPRLTWIGALPDSMFHPPVGPMRLLPGPPPAWTLVALEIALAVSLAALAFGVFTTAASWLTAAQLLFAYGLTYSFGKVDHSILIVLVPVVLSFARWGSTWSIDAMRRAQPPAAQAQWPLRLLAVLIGVSFAYAGLAKAVTGWLNPDYQAALGFFLRQHHENPHDLLQSVLIGSVGWFPWELVDWVIVGLEVGVLLASVSWRLFRVVLAVLCLFHLAVLATLSIDFAWNVIAYGAFVRWSLTPRWAPLDQAVPGVARRAAPLGLLLAVGVGLGFWALPRIPEVTGAVVTVAGAIAGATYLVHLLARATHRAGRGSP